MQTALFSSIHMTNSSSEETILGLGLQSNFLAVGKPQSNFSQHGSFRSPKFTILQTVSYAVLSPSLYATCSHKTSLLIHFLFTYSDIGKYKQNTTTLIALPSHSLPWIYLSILMAVCEIRVSNKKSLCTAPGITQRSQIIISMFLYKSCVTDFTCSY